ncbi:MAG: cytochrome b/b6 domain-containing protein [Thiobacillus sp.]|nr:cytochrome b/b6 domain-containing protein [Thiobacillus sp.]
MPPTGLMRRRVYDPVLRLIHAWNGVAVLLLLGSGELAPRLGLGAEAAGAWRLHVWLGYGLLLGLYARLAWGLLGPAEARWPALWHPDAWRSAWRARRVFVAPERYGHHPVASLAYLLVYAGLSALLLSGLALAAIDRNGGPLYDWLGHAVEAKAYARLPHEAMHYLIWLFVALHLAALVLHRTRHGIPVAQAMVTGHQYLKDER